METPDFSKIEKPPEPSKPIDPSIAWYYEWRDNTTPKQNKYKNNNYSHNYIKSHPELKLNSQRNLTAYFTR
jgi:hypothetical protein